MEIPPNLPNDFDLPASLGNLKNSLKWLRTETKAVSEREPPKFDQLKKAIAALAQEKTAKHIFCPDEFLRQWQELLAKRRTSLEWRVVRALCWEPSIATEINFHHYLDQAWPELNPRALRGLIIVCHIRWSKELAQSQMIEYVRQRLAGYIGPNRTLKRWRDAAAMILGYQGTLKFGKEIVRQKLSIAEACHQWQLDEQSKYVSEAVEIATDMCLSSQRSATCDIQYLLGLLGWKNWLKESFKRVISLAITHERAQHDEQWRERLIVFVLNHEWLGDPRLRATNWVGVSTEARKRFIQWLSKADIVFFFDHVLRHHDPHGRRNFWLRYVGSLAQSRPLLRHDDETRLANEIKRKRGASVSYGRINGVASSFLLDFGSIIAVEFSTSGAIYFYKRQIFNTIVPNFWQWNEFSERNLKRSDDNAGRIVHRGDWQSEAANILAKYGIRPDR
ncbi:MAG: hypothetical protein JNM09_22485 [Blastocatellia bacterium]|nr:hypothetical protein [Blastocatellia bacterium]